MVIRLGALLLTLGLLATACSKASAPTPAVSNPPQELSSPSPSVTSGPETSRVPASVPDEYRAVYGSLDESLESFHEYLDQNRDGAGGDTVFGAELLVANGNRGEVLLVPATMAGVRLYLDRLQEIGAKGVTVAISYPLLRPDFPRSAEYLQFFRQVAQEVRRRGLKLAVESGPVFPDPQYSQVRADFSRLTKETYFQSKKEQLLLIAREVKPDYLSFSGEPTTEKMLTGLDFSPADYVAFVQGTADAVKSLTTGVLVGAGAGTWEDPEYLRRLIADTSVDFINIHIYPVRGPTTDYLRVAVETAEAARAAGKKLIIGESWLYKAAPSEVGKGYQEIFARDVYGFWEPLDTRFIEAMVCLGRYQGFDYVSLFWANYFFAYVDYEAVPKGLSGVDLMARANQAAFANLLAGDFSGTGRVLKRLIAPSSGD